MQTYHEVLLEVLLPIKIKYVHKYNIIIYKYALYTVIIEKL